MYQSLRYAQRGLQTEDRSWVISPETFPIEPMLSERHTDGSACCAWTWRGFRGNYYEQKQRVALMAMRIQVVDCISNSRK